MTIQPVPGASVTLNGLHIGNANHLIFQNLTAGGTEEVWGATNTHLKFITYIQWVYVSSAATPGGTVTPNANVSFEHDRFDNINAGGFEGRLSIRGQDCCSVNSGISVTDSHFGAGGCSDGIQLIGNASGVTIGPGNEFANIVQGSCGAHVDAVQMFGASNITFTGNYFHNNEDGITNYDPGSGPYTATNNVLVGSFYAGAAGIMISSCNGCVARHNTIVNAVNTSLLCGAGNGGSNSTNVTVLGNVMDGGHSAFGATDCAYTATYNLNAGVSGTGNISGTPVYVSSPASGYYHYQLAPGSPGYNAASDGKSMGISP